MKNIKYTSAKKMSLFIYSFPSLPKGLRSLEHPNPTCALRDFVHSESWGACC